MGSKKQPGIRFCGVFLKELNFKFLHHVPDDEFPPLEIEVSNAEPEFNDDESLLIYTIRLNLVFLCDEDKVPYKLSGTFIGVFETIKGKENYSLKKYSEVNAPATMMPFIRETFANITSRTTSQPLLLPPVNLPAIFQKGKKKTK